MSYIMERFKYLVSVAWLIRNEEWKILLAKRWKKANGAIWFYHFPAWHMDWNETIFEALKREMKEEICIDIDEKETTLVHTNHFTLKEDGREFIHLVFEIKKYSWEIKIWEPEKCDDLKFFSEEEIWNINIVWNDKMVIEKLNKGKNISEIILEK